MAIFTKAEDLFELFDQSVGGDPIEGGTPSYETRRIYQPNAGLDVVVKNPSWINTAEDEYPTGVVNYIDKRKILGTITVNNRDWWENSNYDEQSFQPYLTDEKKIVFNQDVTIDGNGEEIIVNESRDDSGLFKFSIDALPFVINPNTNEIIRLDRYHDKKIHSEEYSLATEGKINFYIYPRVEGRTPLGNIDEFGKRSIKRIDGKNVFDVYADDLNSNQGYHLFRLDWGDGTPLEHTTETKLLEGSTLLEHIYQKPGYYTIKGVVMAYDGSEIGSWEKFETTILINASPNYDVDLFDYENFATIGGISSDSVLVKSATDIVGINPLTFEDEKSSPKLVENINLFDRLNIYNFLTKVDHTILDKYVSDFEDYDKEIFDLDYDTLITTTTGGQTSGQIIGCMDPQASNYDPNAEADLDFGTYCEYDVQFKIVAPDFGSDGPNFHIDLYLVNNTEAIKGEAPEDEPYFLEEPRILANQPVVPPNPPDGPGEEITLRIGDQNPFFEIGRKLAYQQTLGIDWIRYDALNLSNNSTVKTIQTNPTNESNRTRTITKSQLLNADRILIGVRKPQASGGQGTQVSYEVEDFSFDVQVVPHSSEEAQGLERNIPNLSSNKVFNVYDNVSANRSDIPNQVQYNSYNHSTLGVISLFNPNGSGERLNGWNYRLGEEIDGINVARQYSGVGSDWDISFDEIPFLELDISQLQDPGATNDNGLNGTYNIDFNIIYRDSDGNFAGGDDLPKGYGGV